jgi:hypothetical protein
MDNMSTIFKSIIIIAATEPPLSLVLSILIFITVCIANWHANSRRVVNYYLSFGERDEKQAYATAEERLYILNGILMMCSGLLAITSLYVMGLI